jgi:hypothetical protein
VNGGNISDGQNEASGSDTDNKVVDLPVKKVPKAQGGYGSGDSSPLLAKIQRMDEYHEREKRRWQDQNNVLSDKLRELRNEGQVKINNLREMFESQTEELVIARQKADKYILRCTDLEDEVDELKKKLSVV